MLSTVSHGDGPCCSREGYRKDSDRSTRQKNNFFLFARFKQNTSSYNIHAIAAKLLILSSIFFYGEK